MSSESHKQTLSGGYPQVKLLITCHVLRSLNDIHEFSFHSVRRSPVTSISKSSVSCYSARQEPVLSSSCIGPPSPRSLNIGWSGALLGIT